MISMWSWQIGSVRGIALKIHVTFPLVLLWAAYQFSRGQVDVPRAALSGVLLALFLFGCVLLHELGHALVALRFHVPVDEIVLLPIGGVAKLRAMRDRPLEEFVIAVAGPLVNLIIAFLLLPMLLLLTDLFSADSLRQAMRWSGGSQVGALLLLLAQAMQQLTAEGMLAYLFFANLMLAFFNLLPAFPMDGGRMFRALLALALPYRWATIIAVRGGQMLAVGLALWGLRMGPGLVLVALFVLISGGSELRRIALREVLLGGRVGTFMMRGVLPLFPQWNLHAVRLLVQQTDQRAFPVMEDGRLLGLVTVRELFNRSPALTVGDVMVHNFSVVPPERSLYDAQITLYGDNQYAAAVMEDNHLLGLLSLDDIERAYLSLRSRSGASKRPTSPPSQRR